MLACRGMTTSDVKKRVLLIGLDPKVVDFAAVPGMDEARLVAGLAAAREAVEAAGFDAQWCLTDSAWEPATAMIAERLCNGSYAAPTAKLCFSMSPESTPDAVLRWVSP